MIKLTSTTIESVVFEEINFERFIQELSTKNLIFLRESHGNYSDAHNSKLIINALNQLDSNLLIGLEYSENTFLAENDICSNHKEITKLYGGNVIPLMKKDNYPEDIEKERAISQTLNHYLLSNKRIIALLGGDHLFFKKGIPSLSLLSETQAVIDQDQNSIIPLNEGIYTIKLKDSFERRSFYGLVGKINK